MKKVLLAFDGQHFSTSAFEFVKQMNCSQPIMVVGLFLPSIDYVELLYSFGAVPAGPMYVTKVHEVDHEVLNKNIAHFKELCIENNIKFSVHKDFDQHIVTKVKEESRFADLLVLSSTTFYSNLGTETQEDYITNVLHKAECPVVLIPGEYKAPKNIILAYDGSEQSVFAIKQFAYLFPEFRSTHALLVYFNTTEKGVPEHKYIEELSALYFEHFSIFKLKIGPKKDLEQWIHDYGNTLLVAGAYGRSAFSEMFKKSFISEVIHDHEVPLFVAHK